MAQVAYDNGISHSNTTLVKVNHSIAELVLSWSLIQIQHLLKLISGFNFTSATAKSIQIQHLLKLIKDAQPTDIEIGTIQIQHLLKLICGLNLAGRLNPQFKYNTC